MRHQSRSICALGHIARYVAIWAVLKLLYITEFSVLRLLAETDI